jgi:type IV pilus assembly protein PilC
MATYSYKARTSTGKKTSGKVEATTKKEALSELRQLGLVVYKINELNSFLYQDIYIGSPLKNKDFVLFLRQFATLIEAGLSLVDTLNILAEQSSSKPLKEALLQVQAEIREGVALSKAMEAHDKLFPELLTSMIRAGEASGNLDTILDRMATYYEKQYTLKQKIKTALTYPSVIGVMAIAITFFLVTFIVPVFADMFLQFDQELPAYTQFILNLSGFMGEYWLVILALVAGGIYGFTLLRKTERTAYFLDECALRLPGIGEFVKKANLARVTQTLSSLLNSSVPILQALEITENVVSNRLVKEVLAESRESLKEGQSMSKPMKESWVFPDMITQMISVGEATGSVDEMLLKVANFYEQELEEASEKLQALIEPLMIVFLAFVVGSIVLAIVIPMFSLFDSIM